MHFSSVNLRELSKSFREEKKKKGCFRVGSFRRQRVYAVSITEHPANSTSDDQLVDLADCVPRGGDFEAMGQPDVELKSRRRSRAFLKEPASRAR